MSLSFVTVTKTVLTTSTAIPLNATQLETIRQSNEVGQILGLTVAGLMVFMGLIILTCWLTLFMRRKPKRALSQVPDVARRYHGSFFPIIGRSRKSTSSVGMQDLSAGGTVAPLGIHTRRTSMWAEGAKPIPAHPSPSITRLSLESETDSRYSLETDFNEESSTLANTASTAPDST